jgi:anti-anti-sigma factor
MNFEERDGTLYCRFDESMSANVCSEISTELADQIAAALVRTPDIKVVFDMSGTRYIASAFLRLCVLYHKKVGKGNFRVEHVSEDVRNVFNITGLTGMLFEEG